MKISQELAAKMNRDRALYRQYGDSFINAPKDIRDSDKIESYLQEQIKQRETESAQEASRKEHDRKVAEFNAKFKEALAKADAEFAPRPVIRRNKDGSMEAVPESRESYAARLKAMNSELRWDNGKAYALGSSYIAKKAARGTISDPTTITGAVAGGLSGDRTVLEGIVDYGEKSDALVRLPDDYVANLYKANYQLWQDEKKVDLGASKRVSEIEQSLVSGSYVPSSAGGTESLADFEQGQERKRLLQSELASLKKQGHSSSSWLSFARENKLGVAGDVVQEVFQELGSYATGKAVNLVAAPLRTAATALKIPARLAPYEAKALQSFSRVTNKIPPSVRAKAVEIATPVGQVTKASVVENVEGFAGTYEGKKQELTQAYIDEGMSEQAARVKAASEASSIAGADLAANILSEALMSSRSIERLLRGQTPGRVEMLKTSGSEMVSEIMAAGGSGVAENLILDKDAFDGVGDKIQQGAVVGFGSGAAISGGAKGVEAYGDYQMGDKVLSRVDAEPDQAPPTAIVSGPTAAPTAPAATEQNRPAGAVVAVDPIEIVAATGSGDLSPVVASAKANVNNDPKLNKDINANAKGIILDILDTAEAKLASGEQLTKEELSTIKTYSDRSATDSKENSQLSKAYQDAERLRDDDLSSDYVFGPKEKGLSTKLEEAVTGGTATTEQTANLTKMQEVMATGKEEFTALQQQAQQQREAKDWNGLAKTVKQMRDKFSASRFEKAIETAKTTSTQTVAPTAAPTVDTTPEVSLSEADIAAAENLPVTPSESKTKTDIKDVRYLAGTQLKKTNAKNATAAQKYAIGKQLRKLNEGERTLIADALKNNKVILVEGGRGNGKNALLDKDGKIYLNVDNLAMRNFHLDVFSAGAQAVKDAVDSIGETTFDKVGRSKDIASKIRHELKHLSNADKAMSQMGSDKDFASFRGDIIRNYVTEEEYTEVQDIYRKPPDERSDEDYEKLYKYEQLLADEQGAWSVEAISMAASNAGFRKSYLKQAKKKGNYKKALAAVKAAQVTRGTALDILNLLNEGTTTAAPRESKTKESIRERSAITAAMNLTDSMVPEEFKSDEPVVASAIYDKLYGGTSLTPQALAGLGVLLEPALTTAVQESDEYYRAVVMALATVGKMKDKDAAAASLRALAEVKLLLNSAERANGYLGTNIASLLNRYNASPNRNEDVAGMLARVADLRLQFEIDRSPSKHNDPYYADLYFIMPSLIGNRRAYDALAGMFLAEATKSVTEDLEDVSSKSYRAGTAIAEAIRAYSTAVVKGDEVKRKKALIDKSVYKDLTSRKISPAAIITRFGELFQERFQYTNIMQETSVIAPPTIDIGKGADRDDAVDFIEAADAAAEEHVDLSDIDFDSLENAYTDFIGDSDVNDVEPDKEADKEYKEATAEEKAAIDGMEESAAPIDDIVTHSVEQADIASGRNAELLDALDKYQQFFIMMDTIGEDNSGLPIAPSRVEKSQLRFSRGRMRGLIARIPGMLARAANVSMLDMLPTTALTAEEAVEAVTKVAEGILRSPRQGKKSLLDAIKESAANIKANFPGSDTASRLNDYADEIAAAKKSGNMLAYANALSGYIGNARAIGDLPPTFTTKEYYQAMAVTNVLRAVHSGQSAENILASLKLTVIKEDPDLAGPGAKNTDLLPLPANRAAIQKNVANALNKAKIGLAKLLRELETSAGSSLYDLGWGDLQANEDGTLSIKDRGTGASSMVYIRLSAKDADKILNPAKYPELDPAMARVHQKIAKHLTKIKEGKRTVYMMPTKVDVLADILADSIPKSVVLDARNLPWLLNTHFSLLPLTNTVVSDLDVDEEGVSARKGMAVREIPAGKAQLEKIFNEINAKGWPVVLEGSDYSRFDRTTDGKSVTIVGLKDGKIQLNPPDPQTIVWRWKEGSTERLVATSADPSQFSDEVRDKLFSLDWKKSFYITSVQDRENTVTFSTSYSYIQVASDSLKFDTVLTKNGKSTYVKSTEVAPNVSRGDTRTRAVRALALAGQALAYSRQKLEETENRKGVTTKEVDEARGRFVAANAKYARLKDEVAMLSAVSYGGEVGETGSIEERNLLEEILSGYHNYSDEGVYTYTMPDGTTMDIQLEGNSRDRADSYFYRKGTLEADVGADIISRETIDWNDRNKSRSVRSEDSDYFKTKYYREEEVIPADVMSGLKEMFGISDDTSIEMGRKLDKLREDQKQVEAAIAEEEALPEADRDTLRLTTYKQTRGDIIGAAIDLQRQMSPLSGELSYILSDLTLTDFTADYTSLTGYSKAAEKMKVLMNRIGQKPIISQNNIKDYSRTVPMLSVVVPFDLATDDAARAEYRKRAEAALNKGVILAIPQTSYMSYLSGSSWAESVFTNRDDVEIVRDKGILFVRTKSSLNLPGAPTLADVLAFKFTNAAQELKNIPKGQKDATLYHYARMKEKQASMLPSPMFKFMNSANSISREALFDSVLNSVASGKYAPGVLKRIGLSIVRDVANTAASINGVYGVPVDDKIAMYFSPITVDGKEVRFDMKDTKWFTTEGNPIVIMRKFISATRKTATTNLQAVESEIALINDTIAKENSTNQDILRAKFAPRLKTLNMRLVDTKAAISRLDDMEKLLDSRARSAMRSYLQRLMKTEDDGTPVYNPSFVDRLVEYGIPARAEKPIDTSSYNYPVYDSVRQRFARVVHGWEIPWITPDNTPLSWKEVRGDNLYEPRFMSQDERDAAAKHAEYMEYLATVKSDPYLGWDPMKVDPLQVKALERSLAMRAYEAGADYSFIFSARGPQWEHPEDRADREARKQEHQAKKAEIRAKWAALQNVDTAKITPRESKRIAQKRGMLRRLWDSFNSLDLSASTIRAAESVKTSYILEAQSDAEDMSNLVNSLYKDNPDTGMQLLEDIADGMTVSISSELYNTLSAALEGAIFDKYGPDGVTVLNRAKAMRARLHELNVSIVDTLSGTPGLDYGKATAQLISLMNDSFSEYLTRSYAAHHLKTGEIWKKKISSSLMSIMGSEKQLEFLTDEGQKVADEAVDALLNAPYLFSGFEERGDFSREAAAQFLNDWMKGTLSGDTTPIASVYNTLTVEGRSSLEERKLNGPEYAPFRKMLGEVEGLGGRLVASTVALSSIHAAARAVSQLIDMGIAVPTYSSQYRSNPGDYFVLGKTFTTQFGGLFDQIAIPSHLKGQFQSSFDSSADNVVIDSAKTFFGSIKAYQVLSNMGVWLASLVSQVSHVTRAGFVGAGENNTKNTLRTLRLMKLVAVNAAKGSLLKLPEKSHPDYQDYLILASSGMLDSWASVTDIKVSLLNYSKHEQDVKKVLEGKFTNNDAISFMARMAKRDARAGALTGLGYIGTMFSALELPLKIFTQLTYIDMLENAKGKSLGREGWALAGQMTIRDIPSQANVPTVISKGTEPFGITQYAGFFHRTLAAISYAPMQNVVAMRKAGVPDSTIAKYLTGVGASMALGMGGVAGAVLFVINLLVEAGAPDDEEEKRRWRELRAKAVEFQQFNNPDGDYVALGVTADGKVPVIDLSFITSFYAQPLVLLKSTIRHLNGEAKDSFFEDVIMKQLPIGLTGDAFVKLGASLVEFFTGQETLPRSDDDGTQITDIFTYKGVGGAYTDYRRTGNLLTFAGIRAKVVNLPFEMNTLAAASFGKPKSIVEDIKNDIINNATTRYTPEMVRERYGYAIRSTKENARMAESLARFFAKRDGIAVDSDEFTDKYAPGDADLALKTLIEKGAEASVASSYGKALKGMSDTESIRGAVNKAKEKNALVSDDMIAHNLRQTQITIKDIVAPYRTARTTNVRFGEVVDGDTLWATVNGQRYEVRIDNTDTAERDTPLVNGVNYYEVAKARLNTLSRGPKPELEYRVDKNGEMMFDDEGRLLAQPYVNGVNIGNKMVKEKLAYGDSDEIPEFQHPAFAKDKY